MSFRARDEGECWPVADKESEVLFLAEALYDQVLAETRQAAEVTRAQLTFLQHSCAAFAAWDVESVSEINELFVPVEYLYRGAEEALNAYPPSLKQKLLDWTKELGARYGSWLEANIQHWEEKSRQIRQEDPD